MAGTAGTVRSDRASTEGRKTPAQLFAYLTGAVLVLVGLIGFAADSGFDTGNGIDGDKLLGIFEINGIHNLVHLGSGLLLLAVAPKRATARYGVLAFGAVYAIVTVWGFIDGDTVANLIPVNLPDNILHALLSGASLLIALSAGALGASARRTHAG